MATSQDLPSMSDEALLAQRFCDLPISIEGSILARRGERLRRELSARDIRLRPHMWLAEEFYTPDDVAGFAIPFYLAHPRLMRLERNQMLEVEAAGEAESRRIMRHEAGHVIDDAFHLHADPRYRRLFGDASMPYPSFYVPKPQDRSYVTNLSNWYAQAHPVEDFAETFAVWLNPHTDWQSDYQGWPALDKLRCVDEMMAEVAGRIVDTDRVEEIDSVATNERTLEEHYAEKKAYYAWVWPDNFDADLKRIFSDDIKQPVSLQALHFLRRHRDLLRARIADGTGIHAYAIDQLLRQMMARCRVLDLHVADTPDATLQRVLVMLTMQTATVLTKGFPKVAL